MSGVAAVSPIVYNAIFSTRRANRGAEAMEETPLYGAMNLTIAGAQVFKGAQAAQQVAKSLSPAAEITATNLGNAVKTFSESSKVVGGVGKALGAVGNYINPFICLTSGVKVLSSENKEDTAKRELVRLGSMFAFEGASKKILGMGDKEALYNNIPFIKNMVSSAKDYCKNNKLFGKVPMTFVPQIVEGLVFAGMSIVGYKVGNAISNKMFGEEKAELTGKKATV